MIPKWKIPKKPKVNETFLFSFHANQIYMVSWQEIQNENGLYSTNQTIRSNDWLRAQHFNNDRNCRTKANNRQKHCVTISIK